MQTWLWNTSMCKTLSCIYYTAHRGYAQRKDIKIKALNRAQKAVLRLVFANILFHKSAILLIF